MMAASSEYSVSRNWRKNSHAAAGDRRLDARGVRGGRPLGTAPEPRERCERHGGRGIEIEPQDPAAAERDAYAHFPSGRVECKHSGYTTFFGHTSRDASCHYHGGGLGLHGEPGEVSVAADGRRVPRAVHGRQLLPERLVAQLAQEPRQVVQRVDGGECACE
jgi:hypothetical protein